MDASPEPCAPPSTNPARTPWIFVGLSYLLSWAIWLIGWQLNGRPVHLGGPMIASITAGSFAPTLSAALLSARAGRPALRAWYAGYFRWRTGWLALCAAGLALPLAMLLLTGLLGYRPAPNSNPGLPRILFYLTIFPASLLNGLATSLLGAGPLGEEGGWRGYLLPACLPRLGELRSALLIGLVWALWHLPILLLFPEWRENTSVGFYLPVYLLGVGGMSLLLTRLWRLSGGSLPLSIWVHGIINALGGFVFEPRAWQAPWSPEVRVLHFTAGIWMAALVVSGLARRAGTRSSESPGRRP